MDLIAIGNRLRNLRGSKSREEIAYRIGISVSSLALYESGKRLPRDEIKLKISALYGLSVQELFFADQQTEEKDVQS